jgi:glycosyltransferase involved in cell wall biosynthesis
VPEICVLMPVYNGERFLREAIASVLGQSFTDWELLVLDDSSTDKTASIVEEFARQDPRVRHIVLPGLGLCGSLNEGLQRASSPYVARMDADDVCLPGRFAAQWEHFFAHPELDVLGTAIICIDEQGRRENVVVHPAGAQLPPAMQRTCVLAHPSVMAKTSALQGLGGYSRAFSHAEDYDLWLRALDAGLRLDNLSLPLLLYRRHAGNVSRSKAARMALCMALGRCCSALRRQVLMDPREHFPSPLELPPLMALFDGLGQGRLFRLELLRALVEHMGTYCQQDADLALDLAKHCRAQGVRLEPDHLLRAARRCLRGGHRRQAASLAWISLCQSPLGSLKALWLLARKP